jgi:hypothetical protein
MCHYRDLFSGGMAEELGNKSLGLPWVGRLLEICVPSISVDSETLRQTPGARSIRLTVRIE